MKGVQKRASPAVELFQQQAMAEEGLVDAEEMASADL